MHNFSIYFILEWYTLRVSDGLSVHNQESKTVRTASGMSYRFCGCLLAEPLWHIPDAVCTVLDSWWWTKRMSETCRVLFQNRIYLWYCASGWFYYRSTILRCTVLQTSNSSPILSSCFWVCPCCIVLQHREMFNMKLFFVKGIFRKKNMSFLHFCYTTRSPHANSRALRLSFVWGVLAFPCASCKFYPPEHIWFFSSWWHCFTK